MSDALPPLTPMKIAASLAGILLGGTLLWDHPGMGAVAILSWPRLLLTSLPLLLVLFLVERRLSRRARTGEFPRYPALFSVLLVLLGLSVVATGAPNSLGPSTSRVVHPRVLRLVDVAWRAVTSVGDPVPGDKPERAAEGLVVVDSWRQPGLDVQLSLPAEELDRGHAIPGAELEVVDADGFLNVPFVRAARFVNR